MNEGSGGSDEGHDEGEVRVWLVERTYSDDEQNLVISVYATPDGGRYYRQERALTSFSGASGTPASKKVSEDDLGEVEDEDVERYVREVERVKERYEPDEPV